jgi:S1-C subfamily serine protease
LRGTRRDAQGRLILGDIIVGIENDAVQSLDDLMNALDKHQVGDTVSVTIVRNDDRQTLPVTLQALR